MTDGKNNEIEKLEYAESEKNKGYQLLSPLSNIYDGAFLQRKMIAKFMTEVDSTSLERKYKKSSWLCNGTNTGYKRSDL